MKSSSTLGKPSSSAIPTPRHSHALAQDLAKAFTAIP